jgi:riboflavin synthase
MFTGIIEELGVVDAIAGQGDAARLTVRAPHVLAGTSLGDSIAVNGCCLTVAEKELETFTADVMRETLDKTSLGVLEPGAKVNLERAVTPTSRLGGHIVQGHVDGLGTISHRERSKHWDLVTVELPDDLARYLVPKGSVTVDGISLTVVSTSSTTRGSGSTTGASFTVSLIPETLARTTLGIKGPGDPVNLEVDVIAKYVERLLGTREDAQ